MNDATHSASRIKTLRLGSTPGASAITQLATALMKRGQSCAARISVASFLCPTYPALVRIGVGPQRHK